MTSFLKRFTVNKFSLLSPQKIANFAYYIVLLYGQTRQRNTFTIIFIFFLLQQTLAGVKQTLLSIISLLFCVAKPVFSHYQISTVNVIFFRWIPALAGRKYYIRPNFGASNFLHYCLFKRNILPAFWNLKKLEWHVTVRKRLKQLTFRATTGFPAKWTSEKRAQGFHTDDASLPRSR